MLVYTEKPRHAAAVLCAALWLMVAGFSAPAQAGEWRPAGQPDTGRYGHTATRLADGRVLVVGGMDEYKDGIITSCTDSVRIYDPADDRWMVARPLPERRCRHTAVSLQDGSVLIAGGQTGKDVGSDRGAEESLSSVLLYDPMSDNWRAATGLGETRYWHVAERLFDGKVLVSGGFSQGIGNYSLEVYDPADDGWMLVEKMQEGRLFEEGAVLLSDDRVLLVGSVWSSSGRVAAAITYDPELEKVRPAGRPELSGTGMTLTRLKDGRVLLAGGWSESVDGESRLLSRTEIYDPATDKWEAGPDMLTARAQHAATLLADGRVLVTGGDGGRCRQLSRAELFDPVSNRWRAAGDMAIARKQHTATLLADGDVLIVGGTEGRHLPELAERYRP